MGMFTGIIEEIGIIKSFCRHSNGAKIEVECTKVLNDTKLGYSISINGVCQTVVEIAANTFCADVSEETLKVTNFADIKIGDKVNLERALTLNSRLGGHIVSGHVDTLGKLLSVEKLSDFYNLKFEILGGQEKYVVKKGSITINGISLTVAELDGCVVKIAIIPHTFENTNLQELKIGDFVNIETDILGKYVEKFLSSQDNSSSISIKFLEENGFV
jgi:riboflavin synthase